MASPNMLNSALYPSHSPLTAALNSSHFGGPGATISMLHQSIGAMRMKNQYWYEILVCHNMIINHHTLSICEIVKIALGREDYRDYMAYGKSEQVKKGKRIMDSKASSETRKGNYYYRLCNL